VELEQRWWITLLQDILDQFILPEPYLEVKFMRIIGSRRGDGKMWGLLASFARQQPPHITPTPENPKEPFMIYSVCAE